VKGLLDVNLLELEAGDPPLLTRLGTDVILLCDVIFALVKPQADTSGVTDEQFGAALGGEPPFLPPYQGGKEGGRRRQRCTRNSSIFSGAWAGST
ncbi:MAG: hypothetical protein KJ749_03615, partial [Planctomycetes bacterium]|nr:hypothetical protein [Planctomycetota bacterium]